MTTLAFSLHPDFHAASAPIGDLELCQARLQLDARFPWIILIPRVPGVREIADLTPDHRGMLIEEITLASVAVRRLGEAIDRPIEKLNVAALGNVTPQLHVHVIGRRRDDGQWPNPVWGRGEARVYEREGFDLALKTAKAALELAP
jgi:diadenosine tetraphosphate (Ap4A) HIT family hydrolase